ncbi:MAG: hypothetical protein E6Q73_10450 [Pseudorhodobacter sp.]|nr:MAG: hypothetical protein E6Q73_10450 [Pseudorhodobacter sp.]
MFKIMSRMLPALGVFTVAVALSAASVEARQVKTETAPKSAVSNTARLNLLSPPRSGNPVVKVRQMGNGSWICSPAGFGKRSRCYSN